MTTDLAHAFASVAHELAQFGLWFVCFGGAAGGDRTVRHQRRAPTRWRLAANDAHVRGHARTRKKR